MKKLMLAALFCGLCVTSPAQSAVKQIYTGVFDLEAKTCGEDCIEISTRNDKVYRIYACGEIKELRWKVISPNADTIGFTAEDTTDTYDRLFSAEVSRIMGYPALDED